MLCLSSCEFFFLICLVFGCFSIVCLTAIPTFCCLLLLCFPFHFDNWSVLCTIILKTLIGVQMSHPLYLYNAGIPVLPKRFNVYIVWPDNFSYYLHVFHLLLCVWINTCGFIAHPMSNKGRQIALLYHASLSSFTRRTVLCLANR